MFIKPVRGHITFRRMSSEANVDRPGGGLRDPGTRTGALGGDRDVRIPLVKGQDPQVEQRVEQRALPVSANVTGDARG